MRVRFRSVSCVHCAPATAKRLAVVKRLVAIPILVVGGCGTDAATRPPRPTLAATLVTETETAPTEPTVLTGSAASDGSDTVNDPRVDGTAPLTPLASGDTLVADAGTDQIVGANELVYLDGSASRLAGDSEPRFRWAQLSGPSVFLQQAGAAVARFVTPKLETAARLEFILSVSDGVTTAEDAVIVDVDTVVRSEVEPVTDCRFQLAPADGNDPAGIVVGGSPLTIVATAFSVDDTPLLNGQLSWSIDEEDPDAVETESGPVESQTVKRFTFSSGGVHTVSLALTVGTVVVGCQSARTRTLIEQIAVLPSISGTVKDRTGSSLAGIAVFADAGGTTDVTDDTGAFRVQVPLNWSGTVTPQHVRYTFTPAELRFTRVAQDVTDQAFLADAQTVEQLQCSSNADCDDGLYCNGAESCVGGSCVAGSLPCAPKPCNETTDTCGGCTSDAACDDGNPCTDDLCDPVAGCLNTPNDANTCDDGLFCTGVESCASGVCVTTGDPCPGQVCAESSDSCASGVAISGTLTYFDGARAGGVTAIFTGSGSSAGTDFTVVTDTSGMYQQIVPPGWSGTITSDPDHRFQPASLTLSNVTSGLSGQDIVTFRNYYVSPAGSDASGGTLANEFATIQKAADLVDPGDTVYVKAGTYREWVKITRSGTAANPITFRNYQSDVVTIDGEGTRTGCILVGWPDNYTSGHYITVDGFRVTGTKNGTTGGGGAGAIMYHAKNSVFRNLTAFRCGFGGPIAPGALAVGIALRGACQNCTIELCEVYDNYRGGITIGTAGGRTPGSPRNITVDRCYVHDNKDGDDEDSDGIWVSADVNGDSGISITNCIVHDNADDGIDAPSSNGVLMAYNIAFRQGLNTLTGDGNGLKVSTSVGGAPNGGGNHLLHHNIVFANNRGGIDQDISPSAPHNFFYHNTIYGNGEHGLILDVGGGTNVDTAAVAINNIMQSNNRNGGSSLDYRAGSGGCGGSQDNVILDSKYNFVGDGCFHADEGPGSLSGDARFANPDGVIDTTPQGSLQATLDFIKAQVYANFTLQPGSPAIDAGFDLNMSFPAVDDGTTANTGGGTITYFDMGAVERGLSP